MIARLQAGEGETVLEPGSTEEQLAILLFAVVLLSFWFLHRAVRRGLEPRLLDTVTVAASGAASPGQRVFQALDLIGVLLLFFMGQVLVPAGYAIAKTGTLDVEPSFFADLSIVASLVLGAGAMALPCLYLGYLGFWRRPVLATLGVVGHVRGAKGLYSLSRYAALFPFILGLGLVTQLLYGVAGLEPPSQDVALQIQEGLADASPWLVVLAVGVVPLVEEILFRGFLLEFVRERAGDLAGILVSSAVFAVLHGTAAALPIFGLACLLASIKLRTRSLYAAWLIHAAHNGLQTFLLSAGVTP